METELLAQERHAYIRRRLVADGRVVAADLAAALNISVDTIRRDLRELAAEGKCQRVYGGALPPAPKEADFNGRIAIMPERKRALAGAVVQLLEPRMSVFIDAGTTNLAIACAIPAELKLRVTTNAPSIAAALLAHPAVEVAIIGGALDKETGAVLGARAMRDIAQLRPDIAILGACGFDADFGLTAHTLEEAELKRQVAGQSHAVLTAITNDKLGTAAGFQVCEAKDCTYIIAENDAPAEHVGAIAAENITIHQAAQVAAASSGARV